MAYVFPLVDRRGKDVYIVTVFRGSMVSILTKPEDSMTAAAKRKQAEQCLKELPMQKLEVALDFLRYLKEREQAEDMFRLQTTARGYEDWLSEENDIYDEVFARRKKK
ncbi:MAG: hypothetical protein HY961_04780 [Ignavibacteriae bacterium]|nr:hypothetical protein [Ignavibacteriota bacterium]